MEAMEALGPQVGRASQQASASAVRCKGLEATRIRRSFVCTP